MPATRYGVSPWLHAFPSSKRPSFPLHKGMTTSPVVIVGGGMTGVMSAYACAAAGIRTILLEAERLGSGGSGRASGVFRSEAVPSFRDLEAHAGRRAARAHFDFTRRAALDLVSTAKRLNIRAGIALHDAAPLYRDAPEATEAKASGERATEIFMKEVLPNASAATRELAGELIGTTLSEVGKTFSESPRTAAEIKAYSSAMADMFCAYLNKLAKAT